MTEQTPEQVITRVHREHYTYGERGGYWECRCGRGNIAHPQLHVAEQIATALSEGGWLVKGETVTEWGVRLNNGRTWETPQGTEKAARYWAGWPGRVAVSRQRTRYPDRVGEWEVVE